MPSNHEKYLEHYADLIVKVGLNIQPGQRLLIKATIFRNGVSLNAAPLVRWVTEKAYQAGANLVDVLWGDDEIELLRFKYAPPDSFEEIPSWRFDGTYDIAENGDAVLSIYAQSPDLLNGQDQDAVAKAQKTASTHSKRASDLLIQHGYNWTIAAYPVEGWAQKIFPGDSPEKGLEKLWDVLLDIIRLKAKDPVAAWKAHIEDLTARSDYMNAKQYAGFHYTAPSTDLKVGLPEGHIWQSAQFESQSGITFIANIPTEEIFTIPHKDKTEGVVTATKPLSRGGALIEDITLTFEKGRVVKTTAKKNQEYLQKMIDTDDGAALLGEVALVPHSSPISQSNILFYNTLFDENASCHIALGRAFKFSLVDGVKLSEEEFTAVGGNQSLIHTDIMIGSGEMDIDGLMEDGSTEAVMRSGEWAFDV